MSQFELKYVENHMKVHYKVREMYESSNSVCIVQVNFIVMSSGNIYLAFMSRDKGKLFVLFNLVDSRGEFTIHLVYIYIHY